MRIPPRWLGSLLIITVLEHASLFGARLFASYRTLELGGGAFEVGLVAAAYAFIALILAIPVGRYVDRFGPVWSITAGCAALVVSCVSLGFVSSIPGLLVTNAALGLGQLLVAVGSHAMLANQRPPEGREGRFGLYAAVAAAGQSIGPAVGGLLVGVSFAGGVSQFSIAFFASAAFAATAFGVALGLRYDGVRSTTPDGVTARPESLRIISRRPSVAAAMLASIGVVLSIELMVAYLPILGEQRGFSVEQVAWLLAIRAAASVVARLFLGHLVTRWGAGTLLSRSLWVPAVLIASVPFIPEIIMLALVMALLGLALGIGQPLSIVWISAAVPPDLRGTAAGMRLVGNRLGQLAAPPLLGYAGAALGVGAIFLVLGGILGLGAIAVRVSSIMHTGIRWTAESEPPPTADQR